MLEMLFTSILDTTISPVRVTLMQQPGGVKVGQTHSGPGPQAGFYKPVTITTQNPPTCMAPMTGTYKHLFLLLVLP